MNIKKILPLISDWIFLPILFLSCDGIMHILFHQPMLFTFFAYSTALIARKHSFHAFIFIILLMSIQCNAFPEYEIKTFIIWALLLFIYLYAQKKLRHTESLTYIIVCLGLIIHSFVLYLEVPTLFLSMNYTIIQFFGTLFSVYFSLKLLSAAKKGNR